MIRLIGSIFGFIADIVSATFGFVFGLIRMVFGLLGSLFSVLLWVGVILLIIGVIIAVVKKHRENKAQASRTIELGGESFVSFYDQH